MTDLEVSSTEAIADWIETSVLVSASGHFGRDKLDDLALAEIGATPMRVSMAIDAMARRASVLGDSYPFVVSDIAILRRKCRHAATYAALLFLTPSSVARQTVRASETAVMGELLEEISEAALANFWGQGGSALSFGYPSKHGRPEAFDQAVVWLAGKIGLEAGRGYRPPRRKDGGVDVVAWRQFADRRAGFPVALAQCTIQAETFTKTTDIDLRLWSSWLAMDSDPLSMLVIPGTIRSAGPDWRQLTTVVMVIDRIRLMDLLGRGTDDGRDIDWSTETAAALRAVLGAAEL
ncbi:hypothetical protein GON03_12140 [Nocardioides sp. MAH-18]|uniref:Uncharacterized protein n=1 Tax=Nocardioides agri TaxID=2682843 RepID=A0A6L6XWP5_9ACTN|nr:MULTISPECIES: hypothetical protein [unclassified Nocardioides]MBA2955081.1 hypothetical protein [Nocardioides sp. CGMCC 1.13656]MVQ49935.1 hypothetical protein [Nocardioides sp. MAH-18]